MHKSGDQPGASAPNATNAQMPHRESELLKQILANIPLFGSGKTGPRRKNSIIDKVYNTTSLGTGSRVQRTVGNSVH